MPLGSKKRLRFQLEAGLMPMRWKSCACGENVLRTPALRRRCGSVNRAAASLRAACAAAGPLGQKLAGLVKDGGRSERLDCSRIERRPGCHTWPRIEKRKTQLGQTSPLAPV